ncbi:uncharacterized protein LOC112050063 [Bicyclus anynana]|uniref:Uncharacterized protein LOC112050063 n=1 Tax=Bicyclus anynana TaxID=110368 RepID=A0ABM3M794_BICAN|nr:uncharacterized protein LOC112050063 [Bicyclus anynana]
MSHSVSTDLNRKENTSHTKNRNCRWKYSCKDMVNLDTCRIHSECKNNTTYILDEFPAVNISDPQDLAYLRLRKMLRVTYVDEEVEKILESRNLQLGPQKFNAAEVERLESLAEYFNNIIVKEQLGVTKPQNMNKMTGKYKDTIVSSN